MKALLIWPKFESFSFWNFEKVCKIVGTKYMTPPLGLLTIAALLPDSWEIKIIDENVKMVTEKDMEWAQLVIISSKITHRQRALNLIRMAKNLEKIIAVGGPDVTLNIDVYKKLEPHYICAGEGEITIPLMLDDLDNNILHGLYEANCEADIKQSPIPRFDLINLRDYLYIGVQYSRGCPYKCEFCNVIDIYKKYKTKTPEQIIKELEFLYSLGHRGMVDFFDDNLIGNQRSAKIFLKELIAWSKKRKFPFQFSTSVTINIANDDELLHLIREARFKYLLVGIETPSEEVLKKAKKPQNLGFSIPEAADRIYRLGGATIHSGFLLGLDGEPSDIADQIVECIDETSIPWVMASIVYPLPGTQLSRRLDNEKRLFPKARFFNDESIRDQISAGLQFRPERPSIDVIDDLIRLLNYSFTPERYFSSCADVAVRLNTLPNLMPGFRAFYRNIKSMLKLCLMMTFTSKVKRKSFWKAFRKVLFNNSAGIEALITLSVLYCHFEKLIPYCLEQLEIQKNNILEMGEEEWLALNLKEEDLVSF